MISKNPSARTLDNDIIFVNGLTLTILSLQRSLTGSPLQVLDIGNYYYYSFIINHKDPIGQVIAYC
jgi:hypothetical protein